MALALAAALATGPLRPRDLTPLAATAGQILMHVRTQVGTRVEETANQMADVQKAIRKLIPGEIDTMTDNRVRTVAEVRHAFSKYGGNLGTEGSVAFQFKHVGQLILAPGTSEDKVMEVALEAGADDVITQEDGSIEVLTAPGDWRVWQALKAVAAQAQPAAKAPSAMSAMVNCSPSMKRRLASCASATRHTTPPASASFWI